MAYRLKPKKHEERRTVNESTTPVKVFVTNGSKTTVAFPCYYLEVKEPEKIHNWMLHDYFGWPSPTHPDHICQHVGLHHCHQDLLDEKDLLPIHLKEEGYTKVTIAFPDTIGIPSGSGGNVDIEIGWGPGGTIIGGGSSSGSGSSSGGSITINASATIDTANDWIVRATFESKITSIQTPQDEPVTVPFAIRAQASDKNDTLVIGELVILPAPLVTS